MNQTVFPRVVLALRLLLLLSLLGGLLFYVAVSIHWPIVWDAAVMHYVTFLIHHGLAPYRDITDSNMPGAYLTESLAMHLFGAGDLAWRIYDLFLCLALTLAGISIARPYDWLAGVFGGILFTLFHGSDGPRFTGERDLVMTVLLVCSVASLLSAIRTRRALGMLPFGLAGALAASIKPTCAPLLLILLAAAIILMRRQRTPATPFVGWAAVGWIAVSALVLGFLLVHSSIHDFLFVTRDLLPSYVSLRQLGAAELIRSILPHSLALLAALALLLALLNRGWNAERWLLLLCLIFGAVSYFAQRKGFPYHRYPLVAFLFLFMGFELLSGLRRSGISRAIAAVAILIFVFLGEPHLLQAMRHQNSTFPINLSEGLASDLSRLGPDRLQRNIECYDLTYGCFSALYRLRIFQTNGVTGDLLFFSPTETYAVDYYRNLFWTLNRTRPSDVLVITNQWFQENNSFRKLDAWSAFRQYLDRNYTLVLTRSFPVNDLPPVAGDPPQPAYRIYIRDGTPLLAVAGSQFGAATSTPFELKLARP